MKETKDILSNCTADSRYKAFGSVYRIGEVSKVRYWLAGVLVFIAVALLLPWTQNIRARGAVTTLYQQQRPQQINTIIAGKIVKWCVKEGDYVKRGDTIAVLAEVKDSYLDTGLIMRTREQMDAKEGSIAAYGIKANAMQAQMGALAQSLALKKSQLANKLKQLELKVVGDSMELIAATNDFEIAAEQYRRQQIMRDSGLASLVQLEQRNQKFRSAQAKRVSADVKLSNTRMDLINTRLELSQVEQDYAEKIYKASAERAAAQSEVAAGKGELAKLANQFENYRIRARQYYLTAPQDGQVVQATKAGLNEVVKEGEKIAEIVPDSVSYAVEIFVRPVDLPLLNVGERVRFMFDGFPAIVFSGWPSASYGTFGGKIVAVESSVSDNGKFRVLVGEDSSSKKWPQNLRMGTGASAIALLNEVPVWYELWRNINGFPPDYYSGTKAKDEKKK